MVWKDIAIVLKDTTHRMKCTESLQRNSNAMLFVLA